MALTLLVEFVLQRAEARLKRQLKFFSKELFIIGDEAISESQRIPSRRLDFLERCPVVSFGIAEVQPYDVEVRSRLRWYPKTRQLAKRESSS